jgi:(p)ppGpp synthase/HD superfamily hydrolase
MPLTQKYDEALAFACELHRDHHRKGTEIPYLSHLIAVSSLVLEHTDPRHPHYESLAIAALLHDAIEDRPHGGKTRDDILAKFGPDVLAVVEACSDSDGLDKAPWRERKERYLAHLPEAAPVVMLVSAADKLHNARAILADYRQHGDDLWQRFNGGKDGSLWYYRELAAIFSRYEITRTLSAELNEVVVELHTLARVPLEASPA